MLDLGWQEFLLIAIMTVIVVGPKDLPRVIRTISQWIRKARSLAREFQGSLEEVAREAELDDVRKQVQSVSQDGLSKTIERQIDPDGEIRGSVEEAKRVSDVGDLDAEIRGIESDVKAAPASGSATAGVETAEDFAASALNANPPAAVAAKPAKAAARASSARTSGTKSGTAKSGATKG